MWTLHHIVIVYKKRNFWVFLLDFTTHFYKLLVKTKKKEESIYYAKELKWERFYS